MLNRQVRPLRPVFVAALLFLSSGCVGVEGARTGSPESMSTFSPTATFTPTARLIYDSTPTLPPTYVAEDIGETVNAESIQITG